MQAGSAYTDENVWQALLDETGWNTIQLRDRRYEAVIHMVTCADGAEQFYTDENNQARYDRATSRSFPGLRISMVSLISSGKSNILEQI